MFKKIFLKNLLFATIISFFIFCTLEGSFRIFYFIVNKVNNAKNSSSTITKSEKPHYIDNSKLGWVISPDSNGYRLSANKMCYFQVNSFGLREKETPLEKPKNTIRIVCLGDSITEGPDVDNDGTYPKLLESMLNKTLPQKKYEVINCGIGDYTIRQEVVMLEEIGLKYHPDIVILGYYLNDGRGFVPLKFINPDYRILQFLQRSKFVYGLNKIIFKYMIKIQYKFWDKNRFKWEKLYKENTWKHNKNDLYKLIEDAGRDWGTAWTARGWRIVEKNLNRLIELKNKYNFKLIVINFPVTVQLYSDFTDDYLDRPQTQLRGYCRVHDIPYIDFIPSLRKYPIDELFIDYCHYAPFGLEIIAKTIFGELNKNSMEK